MSDKEEVTSKVTVNQAKLSSLIDALKECLKTQDEDSYHAAIHELLLPTGERCQLILRIEKEDGIGQFESGLELTDFCHCIETQH